MLRTADNTDLASGTTRGTMLEAWQQHWKLNVKGENRPRVRHTRHTLEYLRTYLQEMAYLEPYEQGERPRTLRRRVSWTLRGMLVGNTPRIIRIMKLHPSADWERI